MMGSALAWTTYCIVSIWSTISGVHSIPIQAYVLAVLLAKTSTAFNPVLYLLFNAQFRREVTMLFWCFGCRCPCCSCNADPEEWDDAMRRVFAGKRFHRHFELCGEHVRANRVTGEMGDSDNEAYELSTLRGYDMPTQVELDGWFSDGHDGRRVHHTARVLKKDDALSLRSVSSEENSIISGKKHGEIAGSSKSV